MFSKFIVLGMTLVHSGILYNNLISLICFVFPRQCDMYYYKIFLDWGSALYENRDDVHFSGLGKTLLGQNVF